MDALTGVPTEAPVANPLSGFTATNLDPSMVLLLVYSRFTLQAQKCHLQLRKEKNELTERPNV